MFDYESWNKLGKDNLTLRMLAQDHNEVEIKHSKELQGLRNAIVGGLVVIIALILIKI
jgi:hypothetical protein